MSLLAATEEQAVRTVYPEEVDVVNYDGPFIDQYVAGHQTASCRMTETVIEVGQRHVREINEQMQSEAAAGNSIVVRNTLSRHNLGVGLPAGAKLRFEGSVGYYCGGLNNGASVHIERNAGLGRRRRHGERRHHHRRLCGHGRRRRHGWRHDSRQR